MPATCSAVVMARLTPNKHRAQQHPDRPATRQHGEHDADEAGAMGHEGHEQAGADIGKIGAAQAGEKSRSRARPRSASRTTLIPAASRAAGLAPAASRLRPI